MDDRGYPFATRLRDIPRACNKDQPLRDADDARWVDLSSARGDHTRELARLFQWRTPDAPPTHAVLLSHRGAGKSTEIHRLLAHLDARYHPLYIEADAELSRHHIELEELLVAIATRVEAHFREIGRPLDPKRLREVESWFDSVVTQTDWGRTWRGQVEVGVKAQGGVPFIGKLFADVKALFKQESQYRVQVRNELRKYPDRLREAVNRLLDAARDALGGPELLLVIDNFDRYPPKVMDALMVGGAGTLKALRCNTLYTPPISLYFQPESEPLDALYDCYMMNTVRLRRPDQPFEAFDGPGRDLLEAVLGKRMEIDRLIPHRATRERVIAVTGGAIRDLLDLVSLAAFLADEDFIDAVAVEKAIDRRRTRMRDMVLASGLIDALRKLHARKQVFHDPDDRCLQLLYYRLGFKYNGDGWYDVHPLVAELPEFTGPSDG